MMGGRAIVERLIKIVMVMRGSSALLECEDQFCERCMAKLSPKIKAAIQLNQPIQFVLPAFPAKSPNRNKTLGDLPDLGEQLGLQKLDLMLQAIKSCYAPGATLVICSDGRVFNDIVGVNDRALKEYQSGLKQLLSQQQQARISFFDLEQGYPGLPFTQMRERLVAEHGESLQQIMHAVKLQPNEKKLFNGLHRFIYEDELSRAHGRSKNEVRKHASQITYQVIQRSHAWSNLVAKRFPEAIRLSIHPQTCDSEKLSFQLVESDSAWATPWHNVVVKTKRHFLLMKNSLAQQLNVKLKLQGGQPSHYELLEEDYVY